MTTLDEFIKREKDLLDAFRTYWKCNNDADHDTFPLKMEVEDWAEQFDFFVCAYGTY